MSDILTATLTQALDRAADARSPDGLSAALAEAAARRTALAAQGVRIDESPYLHFLRRFAGESAPAALAASA
jgi:hypothetical protein